MNIIIVRDPRSKPVRLNASRRRLFGAAAGLLGIILVVSGAVGFALGDAFGGNKREARQLLDDLEREVAIQGDTIAALRAENDRQLNALALRLGELQARSARIEALGERLTQIGQLEDGEFDFNQPPALGGPEMTSDVDELGRLDLNAELLALENRLNQQHQELSVLEQLIVDRVLDKSLQPAGRPIKSGWLASHFGSRVDPFTGEPDYHAGIDFSGKNGAEVLAVADGVVVKARKHSQYGNVIDIDHGNGYVTRYAHNSENLVEVGDRVRAGDVIALMGSTGRATGTHVHFEVWYQGRRIDPMQLVSSMRG